MRSKTLIFSALLLTGPALAFTLPNQSSLKPYDCSTCADLTHETLSLSWAIDDKTLGHETLHEQSSRKYQIEASLQQLRKGVAIYTQAPGALIRISPANPNKKPTSEFQIKNSKGAKLSLLDASSLFSKDEALKETAFADNTLAVSQLKEELGSGKFIISSTAELSSQADEDGNFIIQVYDSNSNSELNIATDKPSYSYGDEVTATIRLRDKNINYVIDTIAVTLIPPTGKKIVLDAKALSSNTYEAKYTMLSEKNDRGENWHIDTKVEGSAGKRTLYRHTHTAFSYVIPSAAVKEIARTSADSFNFSAKIEVATDSRYALQTVLFGSDPQGKLHPIQTVQTAAWLPTGLNTLKFSFDSNLKSDYKAPYYLGYTRLTDFGQHKPVYVYDEPIELSKLD
jgi:hypothetical protein